MRFFCVFAVKYTYFQPQNILIEAKNILMISCTYEAKICRTTHVFSKILLTIILMIKIYLLGKIFDKNIFNENDIGKIIFSENIFGKIIFSKNIFFLPFPHLTA